MSMSMGVTLNAVMGGKQFAQSKSLTAEAAATREVELPVAKTGTLAVRTDANTGTLTMTAGHGITTGAKIDLYWDGGSRRNVTVGTVATNSVPIDLGDGDDLPIATTVITAMVQDVEVVAFGFADLVGVAVYGAAKSTIVFAESDDSEVFAIVFDTAGAWAWYEGCGYANPFAADVAKVFLTHGDSTAARTLRYSALYN